MVVIPDLMGPFEGGEVATLGSHFGADRLVFAVFVVLATLGLSPALKKKKPWVGCLFVLGVGDLGFAGHEVGLWVGWVVGSLGRSEWIGGMVELLGLGVGDCGSAQVEFGPWAG